MRVLARLMSSLKRLLNLRESKPKFIILNEDNLEQNPKNPYGKLVESSTFGMDEYFVELNKFENGLYVVIQKEDKVILSKFIGD